MKVYVAAQFHGYDETPSLRILEYPYEKVVEMSTQKGFNIIYFEAELLANVV